MGAFSLAQHRPPTLVGGLVTYNTVRVVPVDSIAHARY